jgi:hypothetical protein
MPAANKLYVDSCAFIDLAKFEARLFGGSDPRRAERERDVWHLKRLLEASRSGLVRILTSVVTIAECTHLRESSQPVPSPETQRFFLSCLRLAVPVFHSFSLVEQSWIEPETYDGAMG